jgi:hypothetical protein
MYHEVIQKQKKVNKELKEKRKDQQRKHTKEEISKKF